MTHQYARASVGHLGSRTDSSHAPEAPECSVRLVSVTLSKIKTKPSADGSSPHANIFVCLEWKTLGGKRGDWMPEVYGRDFNHVQVTGENLN